MNKLALIFGLCPELMIFLYFPSFYSYHDPNMEERVAIMALYQHSIETFCCQNSNCPDFGDRNKGNLSFSGWSGNRKEIRMILCNTCKTRFSERKGTVLWESRLPTEKAISLLEHIREGCGTRATGRLLHLCKDTVTRYLRLSGAHAEKIHDELVSLSPSHEGGSTRREMVLCGKKGKEC